MTSVHDDFPKGAAEGGCGPILFHLLRLAVVCELPEAERESGVTQRGHIFNRRPGADGCTGSRRRFN